MYLGVCELLVGLRGRVRLGLRVWLRVWVWVWVWVGIRVGVGVGVMARVRGSSWRRHCACASTHNLTLTPKPGVVLLTY